MEGGGAESLAGNETGASWRSPLRCFGHTARSHSFLISDAAFGVISGLRSSSAGLRCSLWVSSPGPQGGIVIHGDVILSSAPAARSSGRGRSERVGGTAPGAGWGWGRRVQRADLNTSGRQGTAEDGLSATPPSYWVVADQRPCEVLTGLPHAIAYVIHTSLLG